MENNIPMYYVNSTKISNGNFDFVIELYHHYVKSDTPNSDPESEVKKECSLVMSPGHFKAFANVVNIQLSVFEKQYGEISTNEAGIITKDG